MMSWGFTNLKGMLIQTYSNNCSQETSKKKKKEKKNGVLYHWATFFFHGGHDHDIVDPRSGMRRV